MANSAFIDFILNFFKMAIQTEGVSKLDDVLQNLHDSDIETYTGVIQLGHAFADKLKPSVKNSGTPIDDIFLDAIDNAINISASTNNVVLVDATVVLKALKAASPTIGTTPATPE